MRLSSRRPGFALAILRVGVLLLPFAGEGGCTNNTACFTFSPSEFAANGDSCPAQQDALQNFSDPQCPGPVVTVNGPGQYDGELCCYPVTLQAITPDCATGGSGGSSSSGVTVINPPPPPGPQEAAATAGSGPGSCAPTCDLAVATGMAPCAQPALGAFQALQICIGCAGEVPDAGGCLPVCEGLCGSGGMNGACLMCLTTECGSQLSVCSSE